MDIILLSFLGLTFGCYGLLSAKEYSNRHEDMPQLRRSRSEVKDLYPQSRNAA